MITLDRGAGAPQPQKDAARAGRGPRTPALLLGGIIVVASLATAVVAGGFGRDALRTVVSACIVSKSTLGLSFPCSAVDLGKPGADGYALIRSPGFNSEFLVTTLAPLDGIESPELQTGAATGLWQDAWAARTSVAAALGRPLPRTAVGLAVNASGTRTQDHFHIHIDCVRPAVAAALHGVPDIGAQWRLFPTRLRGDSYWVRSLAGADLTGVNIASLLAASPPAAEVPLQEATVAIVAATLSDGSDGFYLLANWADSSAERLLDHECRGR